MGFGSPIWLLALLPWAGLAIYLRERRGPVSAVPFIDLWPKEAVAPRRRGSRWPNPAILLTLLSLGIVILSAAEPNLPTLSRSVPELSIVLDRGATMALPGRSGNVFRDVLARVGSIAESTRVNLVPVPGQSATTTGAAWARIAAQMGPTALQTNLDSVVQQQLQKTAGPLLVLSDQALTVTDPRVVEIEPEPPVGSVAITSIGAQPLPHPQVMVRLQNHSDLQAITLRIRSGGAVIERKVNLDFKSSSHDEFFDLPALGSTVVAELEGQAHPWSTAQLVRNTPGIRVTASGSLDGALRRFVDIYNADRSPAADARTVYLCDHKLQDDQPGLWISITDDRGHASDANTIAPHPVTAHVTNWPTSGASAMPAGFTAVVNRTDQPLVGIRESPVRQVWLNVASASLPEWEKSADFVIFFANALDWIAAEHEAYTAAPPAHLGEQWHAADNAPADGAQAGEWPGIYQSIDGRKIALNAGPFPSLSTSAGVKTTPELLPWLKTPSSIQNVVLLGSLLGLLGAMLIWPQAKRERPKRV
jgi:hypothetical protein